MDMGFEDVSFEHVTTEPTYKQEEEENPFMMMMMEDDEELILGNLGKKQEEEEEEKNNPFMMMMKMMMMTNLEEEQKKNTFIETNLNNLQEKSSWKIIEKDENYFKKEEEPEINIQMKTRRESYISKMDEALYVPLNYDMKVNIKNRKAFQQEDYLILTLKCYSEQQNEEIILEQKAAMVTLDSAAHFQPKFKSKHSYAKTRQRYYFQMDISSRKAPLKSILVLKSTPFKIFCRRPASKTRSKNKRRNLEKFEKAFHHLVDYAQHQLVDQKEQQHAMHLLQNSLHQQLFVH